jgi:hypothetical protein
MKKYNIEGNVNFFAELEKSMISDSEECLNVCQITGLPLTDKYVKMRCGHVFNYESIYTEICKQKFEFHSYTLDSLSQSDLKMFRESGIQHFIKCPYCRSIQTDLLPYYDELGLMKKYGVNTSDIAYKVVDNMSYMNNTASQSYKCYGYTFTKGICCAVSNVSEKLVPCYNSWVSEIPGLNKMFCPRHIRAYAKEYKICEKKKQIQTRLELKKENKKKKELEKVEKEIKKIEKMAMKKKVTNNVVVATNIINEFVPEDKINDQSTLISGCIAILKTGLRKGLTCDSKVFNDNLCKRHCCK